MITASDIPVHCAHAALVDVADLRPNPRNPNRHPDKQIALLAKNIRAMGWRHPVIVSRLSGLVVAGHGRIEAARLLGVAQVPVDYQNFRDAVEEMTYLVADNRLAELAEIDETALKEMLDDMPDVTLAGFEAALAVAMQSVDATDDAKQDSRDAVQPMDVASTTHKDVFEAVKNCIVIVCDGTKQQEDLFNEFTGRGLKCRLSSM